MLDRLRKMSDHLGMPLDSVWFAYGSLLTLFSVFDSRSQTAAQRLLATKESAVSRACRLGPSQRGARPPTWLVPPSLTLVGSSKSDLVPKHLQGRIAFESISRRIQSGASTDTVCYTQFGGLSQVGYLPWLLNLSPRRSRRVEPEVHDTFRRSRILPRLHSFDRAQLEDALSHVGDKSPDLMDGPFLYEPWTQVLNHSEDAQNSSLIYWAQDDVNTVSVRIRNTFAIDVTAHIHINPRTVTDKKYLFERRNSVINEHT